MAKIIQMAARYDNAIVVLTADGSLFEEARGGAWVPIPSIEGEHIVHIAVRHAGSLVAITAGGGMYEQYRTGVHVGEYDQAWRPLPSLPQEPALY